MSRRPALIALLLGPALAAGQDPHAARDLAVRARDVLERNCLTCHGDKPLRSAVKVLDHKAMSAPAGADRPIPFFSGKPADASLALDLIREGSMPPGSLPKVSDGDIAILENWVKTGAAVYPERFDDEYAHKAILADVEKLKLPELTTARYLSVHHVAATAPAELGTARAEFLTALKGLVRPDTPVEMVDDSATIFRIDLEKAGWHHRPFVKLDNDGKVVGKGKAEERLKATLWDMVLLEYPHAAIPRSSAAFDQVARKYLLHADQVRPVPFMRGDWFVAAVMSSPLWGDLQPLVEYWVGKLEMPAGFKAQVKARPPVVRKAPEPTGVVLPALDAWYEFDGADPPDPGTVKGVSIELARQPRKGPARAFPDDPKHTFREDDTFTLKLAAEPSTHVQFIYINSKGVVENRTVVQLVPKSGEIEAKEPLPDGGYEAPPSPVVHERLRAYAAPHKFPPGEKWRAKLDKGNIERFVHPFFEQDKQTGKIDLADATVTRKTVTIKVVK